MPAIRFSIIVTCYNQRTFIKDAVDSALQIEYAEKEIIVVDDGSVDGSQEILRQYGNTIRLVCLENNQGACAARNQGAAVATGELLVFLDGDDAFLPWALDVYGRIVMEKKPKLILGAMKWFEGMLPVALSEDFPDEIQIVEYRDYLRRDRSFGTSASALVIDRQSFEDTDGWPMDLFPCEDQDIALKLGTSGRTVQILAPPTTFHRSHAAQTVGHVPHFIFPVHKIICNERTGKYPGGEGRSRERHALIGGVVFFWVKRAAKSGLYLDAIKLFIDGWGMILAAVTRRLGVILSGRQPYETIKM